MTYALLKYVKRCHALLIETAYSENISSKIICLSFILEHGHHRCEYHILRVYSLYVHCIVMHLLLHKLERSGSMLI